MLNGTHYIVGLDIGTTSTKAAVFETRNGALVSVQSQGYPLLKRHSDWAEQDPEAIVTAAAGAVSAAIAASGVRPADVLAVGVSAAMHSVIAVGRGGEPLTMSMTWADNRSREQAERLKRDAAGILLYHRTGTPIHAMSPLTKLMWLREQRPDVWRQAGKFVSIKEYVLYRLFGVWITDHSIASTTGLLNLKQLDWDEEALSLAGVDREQLSPLADSRMLLHGLTGAWADKLGLPADIPFVLGASDGALATIASGAFHAGEAAMTVGTSAAIRTVVPEPATDPHMRTFCYALLDGLYMAGGASNNGGVALDWLYRSTGQAEAGSGSYEAWLDKAAQAEPGAGGLIFLPYLSGERSPVYDEDARAMFFGLGLQHNTSHLVRAALEGIAFSLRSILEPIASLSGSSIHTLHASGGLMKLPIWRQIAADVLQCTIHLPPSHDASARGAAAAAMLGINEFSSLAAMERWMVKGTEVQPSPGNQRIYEQLYPLFKRLYPLCRDSFAEMASIQRHGG